MTRNTHQSPEVCRDCGGPLVRAFDASANYDRCRRCGHVFPNGGRA